jgi:subtilisin family serine protease
MEVTSAEDRSTALHSTTLWIPGEESRMRRTRLFRILAVTTAISLALPTIAVPVAAAEKAKPYVVVMAADPITAYADGARGVAATKPAPGKKVDRRSAAVQRYGALLRGDHDRSLEAAGVATAKKLHDYAFALNGYAALLTPSQVDRIQVQKGVIRVLEDQMRYPQTDSTPRYLRLDADGGPYDRGVDGEDVVVGVIDTGIWPEHPSFADDGSYGPSPIGAIPCEFGNTAHNANDKPFTCNNKLLGAREMLETYRAVLGAEPEEFDSARDDSGHGTHTASTAAGNAKVLASIFGKPVARIAGIAPRARVVAYKGLGEQGGFTSDLAAAIDQAVADGVDVINFSIGGGASLPAADEIAFLFAADAGVFVATSAGNDGPDPGTVGNPATMPWVTAVGASTQRRFFEGVVTLGNGKRYRGASVTLNLGRRPLVDAANAGSDICEAGKLDANKVEGKIVLCLRGVTGRLEKSKAVFEAGGVGMILYNTTDVDDLFTDNHWVPSVHVDNQPGLAIKAYVATASNPTARISVRTDSGRPRRTMFRPAPSMTLFSSRGPNAVAPDVIKPDVTAPGLQILAGNSPFPDPDNPAGELFQAIGGTSMSSPHVAGLYALLKQAHPAWSAAAAKSALMTTAYQNVRDNDRVHKADPFDFGAGHVRPGGRWGKGSIAQPGLVYDAGLFEYAAFTCGMDWEVFTPASCDFLDSQGVPSSPVDLNLPSIGISEVAGSQTITRTVTSVANSNARVTYRASVSAPRGFRVKVAPSKITLRRGQSAAFKVTVTNVSAPVDSWRFGSLTWVSKDYKVRSPIAVKGALFDAPAEVVGTGTSGSVSFPVKFGYTGAYTAAAHGLVQATLTHANVKQDANQEFAPGDVTTGGANLHTFTLAGAAFFRIAVPPEATEANADLDIYVVGPNGEEFNSTAGGTDEMIDISNPANGAWKVYVHGWSTPGGDSDYDMWSWAIPSSPGGGSLSIVSAPTSATSATIGTVEAGWSGITAGATGDWYLGAVSHTGASGVMGLTLVNVDNRP